MAGLTESVTPATAASSSLMLPVPALCVACRAALVGLPKVTITVSLGSSLTSPLITIVRSTLRGSLRE